MHDRLRASVLLLMTLWPVERADAAHANVVRASASPVWGDEPRPQPPAPATTTQDKPSIGPKADARSTPEWLRNSRWYEVQVATFAPGDPAPADDAAVAAERALRNVRDRLEYIKGLGFNVVVLTGWTPPQARLFVIAGGGGSHKDPTAQGEAAPPSSGDASQNAAGDSGQTPATSVETGGAARALRELLDAAHRMELRIVLCLDAALLGDATRLPAVDGWRLSSAAPMTSDALRGAAQAVRRAAPQAAIIVAGDSDPPTQEIETDGAVDAVESSRLAPLIGAFVMGDKSVAADAVLDAIRRASEAAPGGGTLRMDVLCGDDRGRLMSALSARRTEGREVHASRALEVAAWRLTVMVHTLAVEAPMMRAGEEVGMTGDRVSLERTRVWWNPDGAAAPDPAFRADFRAVTRLANALHAAHEPLRDGAFRKVLADDDLRVLAFGRMLGRREVIVVVNASTSRQRVEVQVGACEEGMVGVIRPELEAALTPSQHAKLDPLQPVTTEPRLRFAGNRTMVDAQGLVALNLDPLSLKIVIVQEAPGE